MIDIATFNRCVLALAPRFEARSDAPASYADLEASRNFLSRPVWDSASDACIYGDAQVNFAFRAWHDATHLALAAGFDLAGEMRVCREQERMLREAFPSAPAWCERLLRAEIEDQAKFYVATGSFPLDQSDFVLSRLGG